MTQAGKLSGASKEVEQRRIRQEEAKKLREKIDRAKAMAYEMEKDNHDKLVIFLSTNNWWKIGGKSALIYYYRVAKRLGLKPRLNIDTDHRKKFREGIVSVRDIEAFDKKMKSLKLSLDKKLTVEGEVRVYKLDFKLSDEDLERLYHAEEARLAQVNQMVVPRVAIPALYVAIMDVTKKCYTCYKDMKALQRELIGDGLMVYPKRMMECYQLICSEYIPKRKGYLEILVATDKIKSRIALGADMGMIALDRCVFILQRLVFIERVVRNQLGMPDKEKASPIRPRSNESVKKEE